MKRPSTPRHWLLIILTLALLHGLLYVFLVPPWQHYDEPQHFEYAWLLAERDRLPEPRDNDFEMRRQVAQSMLAHDFFRGWSSRPDLVGDPAGQPAWIGDFPQLGDPPLYYLLASLPLQVLGGASVETQLYTARLVSLLLYLATVFAGWGLVGELAGKDHPLRPLVALSLALLPAFTDLMTSVNNDVAAVATLSFFLWGAVRLVQRGFNWRDLLWTVLAAGLCLFAKRTVYLALPLLPLALLFSLLRGRARRWAWAGLVLVALAGLLLAFQWGDARLWYRRSLQPEPARLASPQAPHGEYVFHLSVPAGDRHTQLLQLLPTGLTGRLEGQPLTLGAWVWASQPVELRPPLLLSYFNDQGQPGTIQVDPAPRFVAVQLPPGPWHARSWLLLGALLRPFQQPVDLYFDGVVLAEGHFPIDQPPQFADPQARAGSWGGQPFENLARNGSAEQAWPYLRPPVDALGARAFSDYGQDRLSLALYTLLDPPATGDFYTHTLAELFRTFWARFGWGHVHLLGLRHPYRLLLAVTLLALPGLALAVWRRRQHLGRYPWAALFVLGVAWLGLWTLTVLRGSNYILLYYAHINPVARYAAPVIIPGLLLLNAGWLGLLETRLGSRRLSPRWQFGLLLAAWLALAAWSLISLLLFYAGPG
ncbi:MAG: DUF2142 domain-containing protein [Anaerolineales bacterium]|nr:DUF2142 domain-containing protein [Anaerolineales bacterium]